MNPGADEGSPQITAIIPTYRRPCLLRRAIVSVLAQEEVALQVRVYDNASGDETAAVVAALAAKDQRLHYYCHQTNIGGAANFNFGLRQVDTPFFSLLSDDDYLLPAFYRHALAGLTTHPAAMFWAGVTLNVDENGHIWDARVQRWPRAGMFEPPEGFMMMTGGMAPVWTGIVFRREVLALAGMPDLEAQGPFDLDYCLRVAARFPYLVEKHPSAVFTLNSESFSATQPLSSFWPGWKRMLQKIESDAGLDRAFKERALGALRRDARRMLFRRGANAIAEGRFDFVRDAANALRNDCKQVGRAYLLRTIAEMCARVSPVQRAYTAAYRAAERRIIRSREPLRAEHATLIRHP